jgi:hypothetical protein
MDQKHVAVEFRNRRIGLFFPAGEPLDAAPTAFFSAVIGQAGMIAANTVEDLFPFFDFPLDQKIDRSLFFRALQGPDRPM